MTRDLVASETLTASPGKYFVSVKEEKKGKRKENYKMTTTLHDYWSKAKCNGTTYKIDRRKKGDPKFQASSSTGFGNMSTSGFGVSVSSSFHGCLVDPGGVSGAGWRAKL